MEKGLTGEVMGWLAEHGLDDIGVHELEQVVVDQTDEARRPQARQG